MTSLTPIAPIDIRLTRWKTETGEKIHFRNIDAATDYEGLKDAIEWFKPDTIINFAEQRAAPYSMKSATHKTYTIANNLGSNSNLLAAVTEMNLDPHIVHLGTMGVYGYKSGTSPIPEGYLNVTPRGSNEEWEILYPSNPGSIYHLTKCQDQLLFAFYAKNDGVRVTDLHQGIVWGTETDQSQIHEELINRFDYDGDFGTVLNRFIIQSQLNYPLTVHGTGGQTRAFINIQDTVRCIEKVVFNQNENPHKVRIINQVAETKSVLDLAKIIGELTGVEISFVDNPRNEDAENNLSVNNDTLSKLGLKPIYIRDGIIQEIANVASKYAHRCDTNRIPAISKWNNS